MADDLARLWRQFPAWRVEWDSVIQIPATAGSARPGRVSKQGVYSRVRPGHPHITGAPAQGSGTGTGQKGHRGAAGRYRITLISPL